MSPNVEPQSLTSLTMRACEACNRRKTKCDMTRPICGLCQRTGRACKFPTTRKLPRTSFKRNAPNGPPSGGNLMWLLNLLEDDDATSLLARRDASTAPQAEHHFPIEASSVQIFPSHDFEQSGFQVTAYEPSHQAQAVESPNAAPQPVNDHFRGPTGSHTDCEYQKSPEIALNPAPSSIIPCIPYELAMDLIQMFFDHIQPWLPLLHQPRFLDRCRQELKQGSDCLSGLSLELVLLLTGMFGLSARFSRHRAFANFQPLDRDAQFILPARRAYAELRNTHDPSLLYLQGCIVLGFHAYTHELNSPTWILAGVCVRLAYDLGLSEIDNSDDNVFPCRDEHHYTDLEEMRRACDAQAFAVDRHHFTVNLPLTDHDWFNGKDVQSAELLTTPGQAWKSLLGSANQNPRAWFLIVNHMLSLLFQQLYRKGTDPSEIVMEFESAFNCIKLSWPSSFNILTSPPRFEPETFASCNFIIGTHLMLATAYSLLESASHDPGRVSTPLSTMSQNSDGSRGLRLSSFSQIVARWPPDYMGAAHPFFVCQAMPTVYETEKGYLGTKNRQMVDSVWDTAELVMSRFAERWKLAVEALVVLRTLRNPGPESDANGALRRRFAIFFAREPATNNQRSRRKSLPNDYVPSGAAAEGESLRHMIVHDTQHLEPGGGADHGPVHTTHQDGRSDQDQELPSYGMTPSITMPQMPSDVGPDNTSMYSFSDILGGNPPGHRDMLYRLST